MEGLVGWVGVVLEATAEKELDTDFGIGAVARKHVFQTFMVGYSRFRF
jgi:hypothetical protein